MLAAVVEFPWVLRVTSSPHVCCADAGVTLSARASVSRSASPQKLNR